MLDLFSIENLRKWESQKNKLLRFHWDFYNELAFQRKEIADELKQALCEAAQDSYEFKAWQRIVKYKYCLDPLSPAGSLKEPGGRFNIPNINSSEIQSFPALYIAEDAETAFPEVFGRQKDSQDGKLSVADLALAKGTSFLNVSLSGEVELIVNLFDKKRIKLFLNLIKSFSVSRRLINAAKKLDLPSPGVIKDMRELTNHLLEPNWREACMLFDIPANCQIFGQVVANAKIGGVLYPSKFTGGRCLALFPQNFVDSFVALDEGYPDEVSLERLDVKTWPSMKAKWNI